MPIQGYTPNRNLPKISPGSTDNWDVWYNQSLDALDAPSLIYQITAAQNLSAGQAATIKDDGAGAKKAYLASSGTYTFGDPLGIVSESAAAANPVRVILEGRAQNNSWSFGPADKFVYLSASGAVTTAQTAAKIGYVISASSFFFQPGGSGGGSGGQTNTVAGANGISNTGTDVDAVLSPVYGSTANTVCQGDDGRLHSQNTDGGTNAASFEINYAANSARLLTTGLTANRDFTFPDATTKLVSEGAPASITAQHTFAPATAQAPFALGANAQGQLVTGLNADKLDGQDASAFAASGHNHSGVYEPANANIQSHIAATNNPHTVTPAQVGNGTAQWNANKIQGVDVHTATPTDGQILKYVSANNRWEPGTDNTGGAASPITNLVINGGCEVAQRAAATLTTSYTYGKVDRFLAAGAGTAVSAGGITQDTAAAIGTTGYALHLSGVTITGTGQVFAAQRVESINAKKAKNKNASFSVRVLHDVGSAVNYYLHAYKANSADNFSAQTLISSSSAASVASGTGTLLKFENVAMGDCSNGVEFRIQADCGAVTTKNFRFTEFQFEPSTLASTFEQKLFSDELAACQRYYWENQGMQGPILSGYNAASQSEYYTLGNPVTMRVAPTVTKTGTWTVNNCGQPIVWNSSIHVVMFYTIITATGSFFMHSGGGASTGFTASAEL